MLVNPKGTNWRLYFFRVDEFILGRRLFRTCSIQHFGNCILIRVISCNDLLWSHHIIFADSSTVLFLIFLEIQLFMSTLSLSFSIWVLSTIIILRVSLLFIYQGFLLLKNPPLIWYFLHRLGGSLLFLLLISRTHLITIVIKNFAQLNSSSPSVGLK